ncbi:MAG: TolC family protein [Saprospiraceae bacterium]
MDKLRIGLLILLVINGISFLEAQNEQISLDDCLAAAAQNQPQYQQNALVNQTREAKLDKLSQNWWPKFQVSGQLTWQNEVTQLNLDLPIQGFEAPQIPKTQYRVAGELSQVIFDGGNTSAQKNLTRLESEMELQKANLDQQQLRTSIQEVYFSILQLKNQVSSLKLVSNDLKTRLKKVQALKDNGMVTGRETDNLEVELLKIEQQQNKLMLSLTGLYESLKVLTGIEVGENTYFEMPSTTPGSTTKGEFEVFKAQKALIQEQSEMVDKSKLPRLSAFAMGGYGQPGFNFLDENPAFLFQTGLRLGWNLSSFYTSSKDKEVLSLSQLKIANQEASFDNMIHARQIQLSQEISAYQSMVEQDGIIISLREKIKERSGKQLENGTLTSSDYLHDLNEWSKSMLEKTDDEIQLLKGKYALSELGRP